MTPPILQSAAERGTKGPFFAPRGKPVLRCIAPECGRLTAFRLMVRRHGPGLYRGSDRRLCRAHSRRTERVGWSNIPGEIRGYAKSLKEVKE